MWHEGCMQELARDFAGVMLSQNSLENRGVYYVCVCAYTYTHTHNLEVNTAFKSYGVVFLEIVRDRKMRSDSPKSGWRLRL